MLYSRVPITPESAFQATDVDHLIRVFVQSLESGPNGVFVFNCQVGRGKLCLVGMGMEMGMGTDNRSDSDGAVDVCLQVVQHWDW